MSSTLTENIVLSRTRSQDLRNVRKLNCWGSELSDVSIVKRLPNVEVLSLSLNNIESLEDFGHCKYLQELYLRKNRISSLKELVYLQELPHLKKLWLAENPCADCPNYRMTVLRALPNLEMLDNVLVSTDEAQRALTMGDVLQTNNCKDSGQDESETVGHHLNDEHNSENEVVSVVSEQSAVEDVFEDFNGATQVQEEEDDYVDEVVVDEEVLAVSGRHEIGQDSRPQSTTSHSHFHNHNKQQSGQQSVAASIIGGSSVLDKKSQRFSYPEVGPPQWYPPRESTPRTNGNPTSLLRSVSISDYSPFSNGSSSLLYQQQSSGSLQSNSTTKLGAPVDSGYPPAVVGFESTHSGQLSNGNGQHSKRETNGQNKFSNGENTQRSRLLSKGGKNRNANILSAVLCLIKELDYASLEVVETAIHCRMEEMDD